jgi:hypothetical protein
MVRLATRTTISAGDLSIGAAAGGGIHLCRDDANSGPLAGTSAPGSAWDVGDAGRVQGAEQSGARPVPQDRVGEHEGETEEGIIQKTVDPRRDAAPTMRAIAARYSATTARRSPSRIIAATRSAMAGAGRAFLCLPGVGTRRHGWDSPDHSSTGYIFGTCAPICDLVSYLCSLSERMIS